MTHTSGQESQSNKSTKQTFLQKWSNTELKISGEKQMKEADEISTDGI